MKVAEEEDREEAGWGGRGGPEQELSSLGSGGAAARGQAAAPLPHPVQPPQLQKESISHRTQYSRVSPPYGGFWRCELSRASVVSGSLPESPCPHLFFRAKSHLAGPRPPGPPHPRTPGHQGKNTFLHCLSQVREHWPEGCFVNHLSAEPCRRHCGASTGSGPTSV